MDFKVKACEYRFPFPGRLSMCSSPCFWLRSAFAPLIAAMLGVMALGCTRRLPPSTTPARVMPALQSATPLAPGQGRLIIDVPEGPTAVSQVTLQPVPSTDRTNLSGTNGRQRWTFAEELTLVCEQTPCVLDTPPGNIMLSFPVLNQPGEMSLPELLHVGTEPTILRRHLDVYTPRRSGILWTGVGSFFVSTGGLIAGGVLAAHDDDSRQLAGQITLGVSAVVFALAIWIIRQGVPTLTPGGSIHFSAQ